MRCRALDTDNATAHTHTHTHTHTASCRRFAAIVKWQHCAWTHTFFSAVAGIRWRTAQCPALCDAARLTRTTLQRAHIPIHTHRHTYTNIHKHILSHTLCAHVVSFAWVYRPHAVTVFKNRATSGQCYGCSQPLAKTRITGLDNSETRCCHKSPPCPI